MLFRSCGSRHRYGLAVGNRAKIIFDVGCFLNIGEDHISDIEHPDFEDYLAAKMKLFDKCRCACINMEDEYGNMAFERAAKSRLIEKNISFGRREGVDIMGYEIVPYERGIRFKVKCDSFDEKFVIGMRGLFNVDNALAAIAASKPFGAMETHWLNYLKITDNYIEDRKSVV